ncbi:PTS mannose/fructose/sorbose/N-acetylgalactosamine transporter subunit IIC [Neobacillus kokaensis]|uniref:PTS mannose transporter subunit IICD n=1 Tax=Neobacillus kokaensis TaxID=2759023 RepID=A0ABQ3N1S0_9BACI|nr:PTS sugar transporter subunit IIC [Neobacillus kokaensis]GHH98627.1 PTS mannose transporter subunit IICD [Neobacillus kokaensis]
MDNLLLSSILVALVMWLIFLDKYVTQFFTYRPIVVGPLVGFIMGDVGIGLQVGVIIELMFLGQVFVGTALPPEETFSTGIATAFAVISGSTVVALATALPLAVLGQMAMYFRNMVLTVWTGKKVEDAAKRLSLKGMWFYGQIMPNLFNLVLFAVPTFLAIYFGAETVQAIIDAVPKVIVDGLTVGGQMIGAVGLALLLKSINTKGIWHYFLIGLFFSSYLNINPIGITLIAVICVAMAYFTDKRHEKEVA